MGNKVRDLTGMVFGNIVVKQRIGASDSGSATWLCECRLCGNRFVKPSANIVKNSGIKGCGCGSDVKVVDIAGKRFGKLTVIGRHNENSKDGKSRWLCVCDCGNKIVATGQKIKSGHTKSCGCAKTGINITHGMTESREYEIWCGMKKRCNNKSNEAFNRYGGRGISVCDKWQNDFQAFLDDMGGCPKGHSIDRIDNDGDYTPDNCKWSTPKEQAQNRHERGYFS